MKSAERELAEIERKNQLKSSSSSTDSTKPRTASQLNKEKILALDKQIEEEARQLTSLRAQIKKLTSSTPEGTSTGSTDKAKGAKPEKVEKVDTKKKESSSGDATQQPKIPGMASTPVPENLVPTLCRYRYLTNFAVV